MLNNGRPERCPLKRADSLLSPVDIVNPIKGAMHASTAPSMVFTKGDSTVADRSQSLSTARGAVRDLLLKRGAQPRNGQSSATAA